MQWTTPPRKQVRYVEPTSSKASVDAHQPSTSDEVQPPRLPIEEPGISAPSGHDTSRSQELSGASMLSSPERPQPQRGMCRLRQKLPAAFVLSDGQFNGPVPSSLGEAISEQLLKSSVKPGRRKKTLAWLRERAESGEAQMHGQIVLQADIEEAAKHMRPVRARAAKRKKSPENGDVADDEGAGCVAEKSTEKAGDAKADGEKVDNAKADDAKADDAHADDPKDMAVVASDLPKKLPTKRRRSMKRQRGENRVVPQEHNGTLTDEKKAQVPDDDAEKDQSMVAGSESSSGSDSDSYSSNASEADTQASDLSAEEEVDDEIEGGAGIWKDLMREQLEKHEDLDYTGDWTGCPQPGTDEFNEFAAGVMHAAGVASRPIHVDLNTKADCPDRLPHQETPRFLLHPKSPVTRLLVDHPTGSGKTREMIEVLDNYFFDPRPKVPIFPKEPVCRNFYVELLRWPSRYRDFFCLLRPDHASRVSGTQDWRSVRTHLWTGLAAMPEEEVRAVCKEVREVLEMKSWFYMGYMRRSIRAAFAQRFPGEPLPGAPLRALRYTSAGGMHSQLREEDGLPKSALFKIGFNRGGKNVYSNKIVVMDEVHNLVRTQTQYGEQLSRLRELLQDAKECVLAGFTGTPILSEPHEGRQLLDIIKGCEAMTCGDGGFISSFHMRPTHLFPRSLPRGLPDKILTAKLRRQFVRKVVLNGESLQKYDAKRAEGLPINRLRAYCNMSVFFGAFHDGKYGSKGRVLQDFHLCAPKLHAMAEDVAGSSLKSVVLIDRRTGMDAFLEYLRGLAAKSHPPFEVATMDELADFNAPENLRGDRYRVLVADASSCSEGVSFFAVRRLLLADVATSPTNLVQSVGRAIRMYGHRGLTEHEQSVTTTLYAAGLPRWLRSPLGAWAYRSQRKMEDAREQTSKARHLLRTLKRSGIRTLESLKERLDSYSREKITGPAVDQDGESLLTATDAIGFYESIGMWEEAEIVRKALERRGKKTHKKSQKKKQPPLASAEATRRAESQRQQDSQQTQPPKKVHNTRNWLHRALMVIHASSDVAEVVKRLHLSCLTCDEEALHHLSFASRSIVAALAEMRRHAIDRSVLQALMPPNPAPTESEGESSEREFVITSESSGEDSRPNRMKQEKTEVPLILPPGWTVQKFRRGNAVHETREFVDPNGVRYRTMAMAQQAVAAKRRAANIADMLRSKFEAKLQRSTITPEIAKDPSENPATSDLLHQQTVAMEDVSRPAQEAAAACDNISMPDVEESKEDVHQEETADTGDQEETADQDAHMVDQDDATDQEKTDAKSVEDAHMTEQEGSANAANDSLMPDQSDIQQEDVQYDVTEHPVAPLRESAPNGCV